MGVLGDGLGSLRDGVLGKLSGKEESDGSLDLSGGEGVLLVVSDELGGLSGDFLEDIVDEGVHDGHGSLGDTGLGMNLLEDSVDVDGEGFNSLLLLGGLNFSGLSGASLSWGLWHLLLIIQTGAPLINQSEIEIKLIWVISRFIAI